MNRKFLTSLFKRYIIKHLIIKVIEVLQHVNAKFVKGERAMMKKILVFSTCLLMLGLMIEPVSAQISYCKDIAPELSPNGTCDILETPCTSDADCADDFPAGIGKDNGIGAGLKSDLETKFALIPGQIGGPLLLQQF